MSELRKDPIIDRWVIIATERGKRPSDFGSTMEEKKPAPNCPFCEGNEDKTPPEILSYRKSGTKPNTPGWWTRVVPNKFPALTIEGNLERAGEGIFDMMSGRGAHEVIIETPNHNDTFLTLPVERVEEMLWAYRDRTMDLKKDPLIKYILIFKNNGKAAGASLEHPHSQLIATPSVPKRVGEEIEGSRRYFKYKDRCIYCDMVKQEIDSDQRVVWQNQDFVAICPYASRFPFETWILPKRHDYAYEDITKHEIMGLARIMKKVLSKVEKALNNPPFNYILHTSPCAEDHRAYYHWHIEFMPKLTQVAGFEWGTGFYINPTPPEDATGYLRETEVPELGGTEI